MQEALSELLAGRHGHFQMESGYHSELWFTLDPLLDRREELRPFVSELGRRLAAHGIEAVCGPMTGGAKLARMIADELGIACCHAERFEPPRADGFFPVKYLLPAAQRSVVQDRRIAIVDDAISAGSAARGTYADLLACGARPVALGALFVFGGAAARFATENQLALEGIAPMDFGMWSPVDCPLCRAGVPVEKVSDAA
ncbi:MAG: orotate phosphoribosyltransferase [Opitutae bacterium]|nr:orotate phosphoribosyltransferase [Opitutae bacterium]